MLARAPHPPHPAPLRRQCTTTEEGDETEVKGGDLLDFLSRPASANSTEGVIGKEATQKVGGNLQQWNVQRPFVLLAPPRPPGDGAPPRPGPPADQHVAPAPTARPAAAAVPAPGVPAAAAAASTSELAVRELHEAASPLSRSGRLAGPPIAAAVPRRRVRSPRRPRRPVRRGRRERGHVPPPVRPAVPRDERRRPVGPAGPSPRRPIPGRRRLVRQPVLPLRRRRHGPPGAGGRGGRRTALRGTARGPDRVAADAPLPRLPPRPEAGVPRG